MSILIKGMEMPKSCLHCEFPSEDVNKELYCPFTGIECLNIGRQKDCPLVEVPQHGRLIDADKLKEHCQQEIQRAKEWEEQAESKDEKYTAQAVRACHIWQVLELNHLPTILEAEVET